MSEKAYIKGKCQSGINKCKRPAKYNLYHTVKGKKVWKNVCVVCEGIIGNENEGRNRPCLTA